MKNKDYWYHQAKKFNLRSRAAFKLLHLNDKFNFFRKSRSILDLCSAPGGWLQMCRILSNENCKIFGVDAQKISPIKKCETFIGDITSPNLIGLLEKIVNNTNRKFCIILNDGSPKMGTYWNRDAYNQNILVLYCLPIIRLFLRNNGWFITKIFRSENFNKILFVVKNMFEKVFIKKPRSSRSNSAEIYLICKKFKFRNIDSSKDFSLKSFFNEKIRCASNIFNSANDVPEITYYKNCENYFNFTKNEYLITFSISNIIKFCLFNSIFKNIICQHILTVLVVKKYIEIL